MTAKCYNMAHTGRASPERTCIVTRSVYHHDALIRFALSPTNEVVPDVAATLPGRGVWVLNSSQILASAIKKRSFDRAWRRSVDIPEDLVDRVDILLKGRALEALSLANKAGCVICGYGKVNEHVENAHKFFLLQAADASHDGRDRLARKYLAICKASKIEPHIVDLFKIEQISLAIGRPNVVHAVINREKVAYKFVKAALRADKFRLSAATNEGHLVAKSGKIAIGAGE